jgi:hypothetical protein
MVWRELLLTTVIVGSVASAIGAARDCSPGGVLSGACNGSVEAAVGDRSVDLRIFDRFAGTSGSGGGRLASPGEAGRADRADKSPANCTQNGMYCWEQGPGEAAAPEPGVPAVTIEDLASFAPGPAADELEPAAHIAVRRLPANFVSRATEQVVGGELLGRPVEVRFTPVAFVWETGDGGRVESGTAGATWSALRQDEYTDTATSHRYAERGHFEVRPTVTYAAEFRFDGSAWRPVVGTIDVAGETRQVRVVTVETRLTRGSCLQFPHDTGCE